MSTGLVVGLYVGAGLAVTSLLHTWYVEQTSGAMSFGLPFSDDLRVVRSVEDGYRGAVAVGVVAFVLVASYFWLATPLSSLSIRELLQAKLPALVAGAAVLELLSQVLGGSSWSKFVLDGAVFFMAGILVVSYVQPPSFWNLFTVYATIVPTLGGAWGVWRDYYVANRIADGDAAVLYPHFPSFAYFAGSAGYTLVVSLFLLVGNVE